MELAPADRILLEKAATDEGFGIKEPVDAEWLVYKNLEAVATLRLTKSPAAYIAATDHPAVIDELETRWSVWSGETPPGFVGFSVGSSEALHSLVGDIWRLTRAMPMAPLRAFEEQTHDLPRTTEAERLVVQRVGQSVFRDALLNYWNGACAVTGVAETRLLRASHIKPWAKCETDAERLDVFNGLLLAAHLDAAFDSGLISFADSGQIIVSAAFSESDQTKLGVDRGIKLLRCSTAHQEKLVWHRDHVLIT